MEIFNLGAANLPKAFNLNRRKIANFSLLVFSSAWPGSSTGNLKLFNFKALSEPCLGSASLVSRQCTIEYGIVCLTMNNSQKVTFLNFEPYALKGQHLSSPIVEHVTHY